MGLMTRRDFDHYLSLFDLMENLIQGPDLLIYLRSSIPNLVNKIHKRGRSYENTISIDYLSRLNERYEAWISTYDKSPLLIIDVDNLDFVEKPEDLGSIIERVDGAHPTRRYQSLRNFKNVPRLPNGYNGMFPLAYVPPLWFRVMDPRLMALPHIDGELTRVNIDPDKKEALYAKYGVAGLNENLSATEAA